jgi:heat shock protein 1/8
MSLIIDTINDCSDEEYIEDEYYYCQKKDNNIQETEPMLDNEVKINDQDLDEDIIIGIDLGTTNSCVGIWRKNNLEIIPDKYGNRTIPSVVAFTNKTKYIGREAKKQIEVNTDNTYYEVKRLIGRKYDDETVINDLQFMTYKIDKDEEGNVVLISNLSSRNKTYTPEEISSIILMELKHMAEDYLKRSVNKAVITVPAYFNDSQRQATKDAATIAGLECVRIINEPTAAALAYGLEKSSVSKGKDINVIVYDLGGGTTDVSLLNISNGIFQVLGSAGNTHLGGADFDNRLISYSINQFKKKYEYSELTNLSSLSFQKLKQACEEAKKRLSETTKTTIAVKEFYDNKNLFITITREIFEKVCRDLFILCLKAVDDVLKSCEMDKNNIDEILLVGGATRMPLIRNNLKLFFGGKEPNTSINPDEVVAAGASIQGYILSHESDPFSENVVLLDVIPLSLGVEVIGGVMNVLIPRNSVIPIRRKRKYTTDSDYEKSVFVKVYEGERKMTKDNFLVGEFEFCGIEPAPRGNAQIEITFSVDVNGIINVSAIDLKNNDNNKSISINSNKGRLSPEKIKELVEEASNAEIKDKIEREKLQYFYEIEDLCSNVQTNLNNDEFKLKDVDKTMVSEDIKKIMNWLEEKSYSDRTKKEYLKILSGLKKKYATLILKINHDYDNVKACGGDGIKIESTTIYGNEDDEESVYEELEDDELGIKNIVDEETKKEIRRLREILVSLCYSVFEIISSETLKMEKDHITELKEYVDDILLWVHVKEKISISEYKQKIDELNKVCNEIVEKYSETEIFDDATTNNIKTKRIELEQLCYTLMSCIMSNILALHEDDIQKLKSITSTYLDWLIDIDINIKKAETENSSYDIDENIYQEKIDILNGLCNNLYNNLLNVNIEKDINILNCNECNSEDILKILDKFNTSENYGTSISDLKK